MPPCILSLWHPANRQVPKGGQKGSNWPPPPPPGPPPPLRALLGGSGRPIKASEQRAGRWERPAQGTLPHRAFTDQIPSRLQGGELEGRQGPMDPTEGSTGSASGSAQPIGHQAWVRELPPAGALPGGFV